MRNKQYTITKQQDSSFCFEKKEIATYSELEIKQLVSRLRSDLNECRRQQQRLVEWENEINEQLLQIEKVIES